MGGGKGGSVAPIEATTPPPAPVEEATLSEFTDPEIDKAKVKSKTQGAKSLQIPLGTVSDTPSVTVGTV